MGLLNTETFLRLFVSLMIILLINPLHECAHAWSAYKLGDDTAHREGRMTLNPIAHIEPIGALLLLFFGFGWAKPVPVNPSRFKHPSRDMMLTALAGPVSNLLAAIIGVVAFQLCGCGNYVYILYGGLGLYYEPVTMGYVGLLIYYFVMINLNLFLFNLIPVPPLDGSRVLTYLLPPRAAIWLMRNQRYFYGIVMILMITGILSIPLSFVRQLIFQGLMKAFTFIPAVI